MKGGEKFEPHGAEPHDRVARLLPLRVRSPTARRSSCELLAVKKVREEMGLKNVWVMLPFVRTVDEVKEITEMMNEVGLKRDHDFKLYLMAEVPVIIFMAEEFSEVCDGFSIGSNDLTQLIMGADRDSDVLGQDGLLRREATRPSSGPSPTSSRRRTRRACRWASAGRHRRVYPEFTRVPGAGGHRLHQPEPGHGDQDHRHGGVGGAEDHPGSHAQAQKLNRSKIITFMY